MFECYGDGTQKQVRHGNGTREEARHGNETQKQVRLGNGTREKKNKSMRVELSHTSSVITTLLPYLSRHSLFYTHATTSEHICKYID